MACRSPGAILQIRSAQENSGDSSDQLANVVKQKTPSPRPRASASSAVCRSDAARASVSAAVSTTNATPGSAWCSRRQNSWYVTTFF